MGQRVGWGWRGAVDWGQERSYGGGGFSAQRGRCVRIRRQSTSSPETYKHKSAEVLTNVACVRRRKACRARLKEEEGTQEMQLQIKNKQKNLIIRKRTPYAATWMNLEMIVVSEVNHKKTNIIYHLPVDSKDMIQMNLFTKQKQIPLYIKYIKNKDLLNSTGNYIQYLVITYKGKRSWKSVYIYINIYLYIYLNHFGLHPTLTQLCKSTILQKKKREREGEKIAERGRTFS